MAESLILNLKKLKKIILSKKKKIGINLILI